MKISATAKHLAATLCTTAMLLHGINANAAKPITNPDGTQASTLVICGSTFVSVVQPDQIPAGGSYLKGIIWDFDARDICNLLGLSQSNMDHIDDCKPIEGNSKLLVTSSSHWSVIIDYATRNIDFWTTHSNNAHSAEVLPGNKLAVACSTPCDQVQLYDRSLPNKILHTVELPAAHGVVWNEKRQRLYAVGKKKMGIYRLEGADTDTPKLIEEASVTTPMGSCHDLTPVDENTLCVSGKNSYLFDIDTKKFTELTQFNGRTALKSVNYNVANGEVWYTDATEPEGDYSWSTQTAHHTLDPMGTTDHCTFKTQGLNLYKVRVMYWGGEPAGIDATEADSCNDNPVEWYNMQGMQIADPTPGTLCIRRQGGNATKQIVH